MMEDLIIVEKIRNLPGLNIVNCETHNLSLLHMQIKQLLRRYYEAVGT